MKQLSTSQAAFTIIEVVLFLAISSGLTVIALNGLRGRNEAVQFNQGLRSLESFVQEQLTLVINGQLSSSDISAAVGSGACNGSGSCLLLGRVIEFTRGSSEVNIHIVVGDRLDQDAAIPSETPAQTLAQTNPTVVSTQTKTIDWGIAFDGAYDVAGLPPAATVDKGIVGYLRLPTSTDIVPIGFVLDGNPLPTPTIATIQNEINYTAAASFSTINQDFSGRYCFLGRNGDYAQLQLGQGSRKQGIDLVFEEAFILPGEGC